MARFDGKTVIVTGAGSGIGAATARRFSNEGANVVLAGRTRGKLDAVAKALAPDRTLVQEADVSDLASVERLVATAVARFGGLDVLVNNAGMAEFGGLLEASLDDYRKTMAINVDGVIYGCRAAMPHLLSSKGSIINVSSVSGLGGDWSFAFYNTSKGAVTNLTRSLAMEFGGRGVRVNAVAPSLTVSDMSAGIMEDSGVMAKFAERIPMGRAAKAEEVAAVIAFLASEDASFVNGVNLPVDGGVNASNGQPKLT